MHSKITKKVPLFITFMAMCFAFSSAVFAEAKTHHITVSGKGEVSAVPDTAWVSSGVRTLAQTAVAALDENNKLMTQVIDTVKAAGIDEKNVQTSGFHITYQYDYLDTGERKFRGYEVNNNITVKLTEIDKLGELLDGLVKSGSNEISNIRFGFDDQQALLNQARKQAVQDAKNRAELYADAADVDLGDVISISELESYVQAPGPFLAEARMADKASAAVPVMKGEQTLSASVTVVYELEN